MNNNKKNYKNSFIFIVTLFFCIFFKNPSLFAYNSSAFNDVRNVTGNQCEISDLEDNNADTSRLPPCYKSAYNSTNFLCEVGSFDFDPITSKDRSWNTSNQSCLAFMVTTGVLLQSTFMAARLACAPANPNIYQNALDKIGKNDFKETLKIVYKANSGASNPAVSSALGSIIDPLMLAELTYLTGVCIASAGVNVPCCVASAAAFGTYTAAIASLAIIWDIARKSFETYKICGESYKIWVKDTEGVFKREDSNFAKCLKKSFGNNATFSVSANDPQYNLGSGDMLVFRKYRQLVTSNSNCDKLANPSGVANPLPTDVKNPSLENEYYRQYLFGGVEVQDRGPGACDNPKDDLSKGEKWKDNLGYNDSQFEKQVYYYRGSGMAPNYACDRFLSRGNKNAQGLKAFNCCNERSQNSVCIEGKLGDYIFCSKTGGECKTIEQSGYPSIKFDIFESIAEPNYLCAKSYTVCPYDFNVGGGTDVKDLYAMRPSIVTNFCQYMRHCIKKPEKARINYFDGDTFFLAESCRDLIGDSQLLFNITNLHFSPVKSRNFSAPIVQCLKESLENNFFQISGSTICRDLNETPVNNKCPKSGEVQVKGQKVGLTIFQKLQNNFRYIVKLALVLSVVIFGYQVLIAAPEMYINKKTIMLFLIKFGLVSFFVLGNAWQGFFVNYILKISSDLSTIVFQPESAVRGDSTDGCEFPKYNYQKLRKAKTDGFSSVATEIKNSPSYPPGNEYLRIWDTLDCKVSRAIGYGPDASTANLAKMIFSGFISGPLGITFFFAAFAYGFLLISIVLRAIQITIMSLLGVILLIYVSPLTITCVLFERTKGIFENWWKQLLGFILQPMILFAYLGLLFTVFDNAFIGDARFKNSAGGYNLIPEIDCEPYNSSGINKQVNPKETSVYCILNLDSYKNFTGFEVFDLALPVLTGLNKEKVGALFKAAVLMFVFFSFLDKITIFAKKLVGGVEMKAEMGTNIQDKLKKFTKAVGSRAVNASARFATKHAPAIAKRVARSTSTPKSADPKENSSSGTDSVGSSSSGGSQGSSNADSVGTNSDQN